MTVRRITGQVEFDDGELVNFSINQFGDINRWGNTAWFIGHAVDITEAIASAIVNEES